jgi:hypothetical protein
VPEGRLALKRKTGWGCEEVVEGADFLWKLEEKGGWWQREATICITPDATKKSRLTCGQDLWQAA